MSSQSGSTAFVLSFALQALFVAQLCNVHSLGCRKMEIHLTVVCLLQNRVEAQKREKPETFVIIDEVIIDSLP